MIAPKLTESQFDRIDDYIRQVDADLLITDFNGVLDDYYGVKYDFIADVIGEENYADHFGRLALKTDTAYMSDRTATLEDTIYNYFSEQGLHMSSQSKRRLLEGPRLPKITPEAMNFLGNIGIKAVIFTAQPVGRLEASLDVPGFGDLSIGIVSGVRKPSVDGLVAVLEDSNIRPDDAVMLGDGLIDDILPAKLLGMHTVLVTPFADLHIQE